MKRVLLLGGNGFIGSQIKLLFDQQAEVLTLTAPPSVRLDLVTADEAAWNKLLTTARPDVIVNAAGRTTGTTAGLYEANLLLVSRLLTSLERLHLFPWLVQLGSAAEYGVTPPGRAVDEETTCHPLNDYGASKLAATHLIQEALSLQKARGVVLRVFNPVGVGQSEVTLPGRAARLLREAEMQGQSQVTFGSLASSRDYLDVRHVARATLVAARLGDVQPLGSEVRFADGGRPFTFWPGGTAPGVLNVGSGQARCSRELVKRLARLAGFAGRIGEQSQGSPRSVVPWQQADIWQLRALGWSPHFSLEDALQDLWNSLPTLPLPFLDAELTASGSIDTRS
ncbi:NAD-dependent epimerase/dehydratase (plasmid) [Deinococcus radiomollis]|uniref:NAD-dependent epimerase/dehydratase family protein n=1 Tax=Deinococcus radiomollis TaxID=468916 RepID=UPI0038915524